MVITYRSITRSLYSGLILFEMDFRKHGVLTRHSFAIINIEITQLKNKNVLEQMIIITLFGIQPWCFTVISVM